MANEGKKTRGRQRIEIKKIEKEEDLLVSFSKRRSGIYKKASDMLTLCGGEVAIVIYSPTGKPFSFGQPSVDHVINRYLDRISPDNNDYTHQLMEAHRKMRIEELVERHNERSNTLEDVLERRKALQAKARTRKSSEGFWWNVALDGLNVEELKEVYAQIEEMHMTASDQLKERSDQTADAMFDDANYNPNGVDAAFDPHGYGFGCGY